MNVINKIKDDIHQAMVAKDKSLTGSLKYLYSLLQAEEARGGDFQPVKVLQKEMKSKKEALRLFQQAGRLDLVEKEKNEIKILQKYLPKMMTREEIEAVVEEVISTLDKPEFGQIMGTVMKKIGDKADGALVTEVVKKKLMISH